MAVSLGNALFYSPGLPVFQVQQMFLGLLAPPAETIEFSDEAGGDAARDLAIPLLRNMDEIRIQQAEIRFVVKPKETEIHSHQVVNNSPDGGVFLSLASPGLLKKVLLEYTVPAAAPDSKTRRLVVRTAEKKGSSFTAGPPLFANPGIGAVGAMYGPALPECTLAEQGSNRHLVTVPGVMGSAWLLQLAEGDKVEELNPLSTAIKVVSVSLDSVPKDLAVFLVTSGGEVPLWSSPGLLLPSREEHVISFTPAAQKHLADKLKSAGATDAALPVSLKFHSASAALLEVRSKQLRGVYVARPLGSEPAKIRVSGDRADLALEVPAGLTSKSNSAQLTVRVTGKQRAAASSESPHALSVHGLQVSQTMYAAAGVPVATSDKDVTAARLLLAVHEKTEAVLTVCADAGGAPGQPVGRPAVVTLDLKKGDGPCEETMKPGIPQWIVFTLPAPLTPESTKLWLTLRTNLGSLLWFTDAAGDGAPVISMDKGQTWGSPDTPLSDAQKFLAQLWIDRGAPQASSPAPVVRLERDGSVLNANLLANAQPGSAGEFKASISLPQAELSAPPANGGKVGKRLQLASAAVADVILEGLELTFDPAGSGA